MRILFVLLFLPCLLFSQELNKQYIDSLVSNHQSNNIDAFEKEFVRLGGKIGLQDDALQLYQYLDSISKDRPKITLSFYNKYVSYLYRTSNFKEGLKINSKGLKLAKKYNYSRITFEYLQIKSYGFSSNNVIDSALFYANEAEKLALNNKNSLGNKLHTVYLRKADVETLLGNLEQRDIFYEKAVECLADYPNDRQNGFVLAYVTNHFKHLKNYEKHAYYAQKLKEYYLRRDGFSNPEKHVSISSFLDFENTGEQVQELEKIVNLLSQDSTITINQRYLINSLADGLIKTGNYDKAAFYLEKLLKSDKHLPSIGKLLNYSLLKRAYYLKGDYKSALEVFETRKLLIDSLRAQQMLTKIADNKVKYETEKKEAQLEILKLEKEKEKQKKNLFIIIASLGLLVIALIAYFLCKNRKKNKKLNSQNKILERTIDEKNVLLREVHHRVKNSFQIVSSLLYLQSENVTDEKAKFAIKEAENRVRSMVLVHQKLYNKDELVGINSKEYISDLIKDIFESHDLQKEPIKYNLNIEPIVLDIETITPLGLILNELIINTMKHAFDGIKKDNTINVNFSKINDELVLKVIDNGKGFEGEIKQTSFGITLMKALSKQLKATLNYDSKLKEGTKAILSISKFNVLS